MALAVVGLVALLAATVTPASAFGSDSTPQALGGNSASSPQLEAASGPSCSTRVLKHEYSLALDKWSVGLECSGNTTDETVYVRGVLDVPAALHAHTPWVEIPARTNLIYPPKQVKSSEVNSPWGTPSSRVEEYKCPPVVIGECSPFNDHHEVILAFASLLTSLF